MTYLRTAVLLSLSLVVSGRASTREVPSLAPRIAHAASGTKGETRAVPAAARCAKRNPAAGSIAVGGTTLPPYTGLVRFGLQSTVVEVDAGGHLFPEMASEVPTVRNGGIRDNGKTYVIHLKHGMRWSNGVEITSGDLVFGAKVTAPLCAPDCVVTRVDSPDRYTAVYHLKGIDHDFLQADFPLIEPARWAGFWNNDPQAAAQRLEKAGNLSAFLVEPGAPTDGPYRIAHVDAGTIVYHPMKYYDVMTCGAQIKTITYHSYATTAEYLAALDARKLDLGDIGPDDTAPLTFQRVRGPYRLHVDPSDKPQHVEFNVDASYDGHPNPLHDVRVRQALALALDKRALIANGLGVNARQVSRLMQWALCPNSPAYPHACVDPTITGQWDPITRRYDPNPGRGVALLDAKKLLAGTPWSGGFTLEFLWRAGAALRLAEEQSLATSWSRLGVSLKVVGYTTNDWFKALTTGRFQVVLVAPDNISFLGLDNFIQQDLTSPFIARPGNTEKPSNAQSNFAGISDGVIDHAAAAARATLDEKARTRYLRLVEEELVKKAYWDVLYGVPYCYLEDRRIANLSDSIGDSTAGIYWDEWEWRVK